MRFEAPMRARLTCVTWSVLFAVVVPSRADEPPGKFYQLDSWTERAILFDAVTLKAYVVKTTVL
jgi:hypothetical protein